MNRRDLIPGHRPQRLELGLFEPDSCFEGCNDRSEVGLGQGREEGPHRGEGVVGEISSAREEEIQLVIDLEARCSDEVRHQEHDRRNAFSRQKRERILVDVGISVVERDHGHRLVEWLSGREVRVEIVE